ncbi:MAG: helix-turn-helix transcriptional regulator [Pseudomonadota bacterium]
MMVEKTNSTGFIFDSSDNEEALAQLETEEELQRALSVKPHVNLQKFRISRGLKKSEMAQMMGVSAKSYYLYEVGKRAIPSNALVRLEAFTGADLNEVLLGAPKTPTHERTQYIVDEAIKALCFLGHEHPDMPMQTKRLVVDEMFRWLRDMEKAKPSDVVEAVKLVTRYKYNQEKLPAPPFWEDYGGDQEAFDRDMAVWEKMVEEDLGPLDEDQKERQ